MSAFEAPLIVEQRQRMTYTLIHLSQLSAIVPLLDLLSRSDTAVSFRILYKIVCFQPEVLIVIFSDG